MDLQQVIINNLNRLEDWQQKKLVVGYSGGLDSTVLLSLIDSLKKQFPEIKLSAIHVNHNLMQQSDQWQQHCEKFCKAIQVPINCIKMTSINNSGKGIEDAARQARLAAFEKYSNHNELLLLAHHANDQSETVIFRMLRGSGMVGLSGIKFIQHMNNNTVVRPLLNVEKSDLEAYASNNNLSWVTDDSNQDEKFDRNFIRKNIIPALQKRWPDLHKNLTRNSLLLKQQSDLLDEMAIEDSKALIAEAGYLELDKIKLLSSTRVLNFLSWWFRENIGYCLNNTRLNLIFKELKNYRTEASFQQNCSDSILLQSRNRAYLVPKDFFDTASIDFRLNEMLPEEWKPIFTVTLSKYISIQLEIKSYHDFNQLKKMNLVISYGVVNGKVKFSHKQHSSELRKLFQQNNVPSWLKPYWPVFKFEEDLVSIVGFGHLHNDNYNLSGVKIGCLFSWGDLRHFKI